MNLSIVDIKIIFDIYEGVLQIPPGLEPHYPDDQIELESSIPTQWRKMILGCTEKDCLNTLS